MDECSNRLKKISVLYVEDETNLAKLMNRAIGDRFANFYISYDGVEGFESFKKHYPDIVISDITMPRMDGLTLAGEIGNISPKTPVIILSAYSDKDKLLSAIDKRVIKYFIKPFDPEEILKYICELSNKMEISKDVTIGNNAIFNRQKRVINIGSKSIAISKREALLIEALINEPGCHLDTQSIKKIIWKDKDTTDDAVRVFIKRLRDKIGKDIIKNRVGDGYYIECRQHIN